MNSRSKGARGEREVAGILREYGYPCRRGQQYSGANGDADVVGLPGTHMEQSVRDAREGEMPTVFHRRNNYNWLVTMRLEDFMKLYGDSQ